MKTETKRAIFYWTASALILLAIAAIATAHPPGDCYESSPYCEYVQIATPGGGVRMVYVCE